MSDFPYSIPERRLLTTKERALLQLLLSESSPQRAGEIDRLEVYARCGCGKCPTIMFRPEPEKTKGNEAVIADYRGGDEVSGLVGIMLWERDGQILELEAWSIDGKDVTEWPPLDTIRPLECAQ